MATAFKLHVLNVNTLIAGAPSVHRSLFTLVGVIVLNFGLRRAMELVSIILEEPFHLVVLQDIISGSMRMNDRNRTLSF